VKPKHVGRIILIFSYPVRLFFLSLTIFLISGCNFVSSTAISTTLPTALIPTIIARTVEAQASLTREEETDLRPTASLTPDDLPTPTTTPAPSSTTTALPTVQPTDLIPKHPPSDIPYAAIQIINPGPASRLISPFWLRAVVQAEPGGTVLIELLGEDGRLLLREVKKYAVERRQQITIGVEVNFEVAAVAEAGRLQISVVDEFNRLVSVTSTDLILLSLGKSDVNPATDFFENIVISVPDENILIQGSSLRTSGLARLRADQPLLIELETTDGRIVGTRQVNAIPEPGSTHGTFAIDVPYQVDSPIKARLKIWISDERIPGVLYLSSVEVMLSP
jgi:hypothetical protein